MNMITSWFAGSVIGRYILFGLAVLAAFVWKERRDIRRGKEQGATERQKEDDEEADRIRDAIRAGRVHPAPIEYRD